MERPVTKRFPIPALLAAVLALGGCHRVLMPTPNVIAYGEYDPFTNVPPVLRSSEVELLYVTDRAPIEGADGSLTHGYGRSRSLSFGSCIVEIGDDLSWEELVELSRQRKRSRYPKLAVSSVIELGGQPGSVRRSHRRRDGAISSRPS